jgi:hypothetical protein
MLRKKSQISITVAMLAALAAFAVPAAEAKTNHYYASMIHNAPVWTADGYPAPGGTAVLAGTWISIRYGGGALVDYVTVTGHPTPATFTFKGTEVGFVALGTFNDSFTGTAIVHSDGTETLVTRGRFTGGSGAYRGATGHFKFTGATAPGSTVVSGRSAGTISY